MPKTVATKPYDWTYTTVYTGHLEGTSASFVPADTDNPAHTIPMAELTRPDPILFYAEVPLFEDELHDNGTSQLLVKIVSNTALNTCCLTSINAARHANLYIYSFSVLSEGR